MLVFLVFSPGSVNVSGSASGSTLCERALVPRRSGLLGAVNSSSVGVVLPPRRDVFVAGAAGISISDSVAESTFRALPLNFALG